MRFALRAFKGLVATVLTLAFVGYGGWHFKNAQRSERPARSDVSERVYKVRAGLLERQSVTPEIAAFGRIKSWRRTPLSSPVPGEVIWISENLRDGAQVQTGEVLLRIDPLRAELALSQAQTAWSEASARRAEAVEALALAQSEFEAASTMLELRERQLGRQRELANKGSTSQAALDQATMERVAAEQSVAAKRLATVRAENAVTYSELDMKTARIAVDRAERDLDDTSIEAPFDGVLTKVDAALGRSVSGNAALAEVVDLDALEVEIDLTAADLDRLVDTEGNLLPQPVVVSQRTAGVELTAIAELRRASAEGQTTGSGRQVYAGLGETSAFRPGDFVAVSIDEPILHDVATVPQSALGSDRTLLAIDEELRLFELDVNIVGRIGEMIILRDVPFGVRYVTNRLAQLGAGSKVEIVDQPLAGGVVSRDSASKARDG